MKDIKKNKDRMNPEFFTEVERFKGMLHSNIGPKKSCNEGEYVTGEGNNPFTCKLIVVIFCCDAKLGRSYLLDGKSKKEAFLKFRK